MDMKESFEYRYGIPWDQFEDRNTKFIWVMVWEHAVEYQKKLNEEKLNKIKELL